jgi:hypothetical protein
MTSIEKLWIGIDWGTHSSKWACVHPLAQGPLAGQIHSSALVRENGFLILPKGQDIPKGDETIEGLKGKIILDPLGQSFWNADRMDTNTSMGEAVTFSFCCLLADVDLALKSADVCIDPHTEVEVGFSLPNWLRDDNNKSRAALHHFHEAASVACCIFRSGLELPIPGVRYTIAVWKEIVSRAATKCLAGVEEMISIDTLTSRSYTLDKIKWGYLVESCAAGLPYLKSSIEEIEEGSPLGLKGLGKLLVIDAGAGSTDVGYMLRTLNTQGKENLFYFPPAATFGVAGNDLTDRLWEHYRQQGREMAREEAEARKLGEGDWRDLEFAKEWRHKICQHVKEYVRGITDKRWLPTEVPLQVVVTGGSAVVYALKDEIRSAVVEGLKGLGIESRTYKETKVITTSLGGWKFDDEAEYARRAVSIGATDPNKPSLKYCSALEKPTKLSKTPYRY